MTKTAKKRRSPASELKSRQSSLTTYGLVFQNGPETDQKTLGKRWVEDGLEIIYHRLEQASNLRKLPLDSPTARRVMKECFSFLRKNKSEVFESDNFKHVSRLVAEMKAYGPELKSFLDIDYEDAQLLAALHDLGKSEVPEAMLVYLKSIFGENDFVSLRVLPHEMYSMYWIEQLGKQLGLSLETRHILMDQIANHNFGPDLSDPKNKFLISKNKKGAPTHWWVEHWKRWTQTAAYHGVPVTADYGHTISPLATTLVFFDRIDGGDPRSWEKFLNQDLISGRLEFSAKNLTQILENSNNSARDQIRAVGKQLSAAFVGKHRKTPIEKFAPYPAALKMIDKSASVIKRVQRANSARNWKAMEVDPTTSILYQCQRKRWFKVQSPSVPGTRAQKYVWDESAWRVVATSESAVGLLLDTLYSDWV